jgi:hypothetical protein
MIMHVVSTVSNKAQLCAHHGMKMDWSWVWNLDKVAVEYFQKADCSSQTVRNGRFIDSPKKRVIWLKCQLV